jgi:enoyl-CoA hydratase
MAIEYEKKGPIAVVTLNRPEAMNCVNLEDMEELGQVWIDFRDDDELRVAILTGAGEKSFSAGADLADLIPRINAGEVRLQPIQAAFLKGIECYKPIVAAVNGFCLAGGTEILQGTDIRISVPEAIFGIPEVKWALFPAAGSTVHLPRQIPYCRAMEMLLLGETMTAEQALAVGLINRIVPREKLMPTAMDIAERLCANGPLAVKAIKEAVLKSMDIPRQHAYYLETFLASRVFGTRDAAEGPRAFVERRKPVYEGR